MKAATLALWLAFYASGPTLAPREHPTLEPSTAPTPIEFVTDLSPVSPTWLILGLGMGAIAGVVAGMLVAFKISHADLFATH